MDDEKEQKLPEFVTKKGDGEVIDLTAGLLKYGATKDPVCHALLCLMSAPGRDLTDFGFDPKASGENRTQYEANLTINGVPVSFCAIVQRLYKTWENDVTREAKAQIDDLAGAKMRELEDDIQAVRDRLRDKFSEVFLDRK